MIGNTAALPIPVFIMHPKKNKKETLPVWGGLFVGNLLPGEADHTHDVNDDNSHGNYIAKDRLHPVLDLQTLTGIGFSQHVVPAPAIALAAAEQRNDQRAQRQDRKSVV